MMVLRFKVEEGRIAEIEAIAEPERVARLDLAMLGS